MRFENQVLFVTGGASGIGLATAQRVVAEGGRAALVDLDLGRAQEAAASLPGCIGLVTGKDSDAEKDVLRNAQLRWPQVRWGAKR